MDREKLRDKVKKDIRALLISAPLGVPAHIFSKDYRQMNGKEVPYRDIGHRSLDDFIMSIPDVVRVGMGPTGMVTFYPIATKETEHIMNMIRKQKKPSIKKGVMPSAIVVRKTPVKMSSFSRRSAGFGARHTPRGGGGGGWNRKPQARNHPRSYSQPGSSSHPPPNLPPRLQRAHQHSSTFQPRFHAVAQGQPPHSSSSSSSLSSGFGGPSHQQHYYQHRGFGGARQQQQQQPLQPQWRPEGGGGGGGGGSRPRVGSASDNPGNRLHPQHTLSSLSAANRQPPQSLSPTATTATATATTGGGSSGLSGISGLSGLSGLWREEFSTVCLKTVEELNRWTRTNPKTEEQNNPVCVEGVTSRQKEDVYLEKKVLKILLRSARRRGRAESSSQSEAVQLHFITPYWDLEAYRQPYDLPEGVKLKAYGNAFAAYIRAKNRAEPAMRVLYYERVEDSGSSAGSSPQESRSTTPKSTTEMESKPSDLDDNIFKLLLKFERGTYAKRLGKVYQNEFKKLPPENILQFARAMPFVRIVKVTDMDEIMHLKEEYRDKKPREPEQMTSSYRIVRELKSPPATPPLPGTVSFSDDPERLYEVLVCLVNSPFSFYVQIRDDNQGQMLEEMEEQMNKHFGKKPLRREIVEVKENQLFASLWGDESEGQWCRAMVISLQDSKANVQFPDYGNTEWVPISGLRPLPHQFHKLPFQAIHCCLHGVLMKDKMMSTEAADYFSELASEKICALHVVDCSGARASVEILDKGLDDDDNINSKLISKFHPIASLSPKLPSPEEPMVAVKLTDIDETGILSIQVMGPGLSKLEELTNQIEEKCSSTGRGVQVELVVGALYCTKYSRDDCWYRVRVLKLESSRQVLVEYVDYGNEELVDSSSLRPKLDTALFSLPPQVVKCKLAGIPPPEGKWTDSAMECIVHYIDTDELNLEVVDYSVKVTGSLSVALPVVRLHVRSSDQEDMVCINDTLLQNRSLFGMAGNSQPSSGLPSRPLSVEPKPRPVSSAVEPTSPLGGGRVVEQRSKSVSSLPPPTPPQVSCSSLASDTVFDEQALASVSKTVQQRDSNLGIASSTTGGANLFNNGLTVHKSRSTSPGGVNTSTLLLSGGGGGDTHSGAQVHTLTVGSHDSCEESSSISSLNQSASEVESGDALGDEGGSSGSSNESPNRPTTSTAAQIARQSSPLLNMNRLTLVDSPKHCVMRHDAPYVPTIPVEGVVAVSQKPSHLASPPSAPRLASTSSHQAQSPSPQAPSSPPRTLVSSPSNTPTTPPMSPPPVASEGGGAGGGASYKWTELPSGRCVEVEVTWASSPTNFTLLLLSCKAELELMSRRLQQLIPAQSLTNPHKLSTGFVCAVKYSLDSLWYRAIVRQPFQVSSMQVGVEFLDYGGSELVSLSAVKYLPEECKSLPFQAIKASLYGVSGDVYSSPEMVKRFEEMVFRKQLYAARKEHDTTTSRVSVLLLDTSDPSGKDIVINEALTSYVNP